MGHQVEMICQDCSARVSVRQGGGVLFEVTRCDKCGAEKNVGNAAVGIEPEDSIYEEDIWPKKIEEVAGTCKCGGQFKIDAPPRCPECGSVNLKQDPDGEVVYYD